MRLLKALVTGLVVVGALLVGVAVAIVLAATSIGRALGRRLEKGPTRSPVGTRRATGTRIIRDDDVIEVTAREVPGNTAKS